jgi:hypothetical protein
MKNRVLLACIAATCFLSNCCTDARAQASSWGVANRSYLAEGIAPPVIRCETGNNYTNGTVSRGVGFRTAAVSIRTAVRADFRSTHGSVVSVSTGRSRLSLSFPGPMSVYGLGLAVSGTSAEARSPVVWRFQGVAKLDFGKVWNALKHFDFDPHKWVAKPSVTFRLDAAPFSARVDVCSDERVDLHFNFRQML